MGTIINLDKPHMAIVLLVDTSCNVSLKKLNEGLQAFQEAILSDWFVECGDICVLGFDKEVKMLVPFCPVSEFKMPEVKRCEKSGCAMNAAIITGLDIIDAQKQLYKELFLDYMRPKLFLLSDGFPTDDEYETGAKNQLQWLQNKCALDFYCHAISDNVNFAHLKSYTEDVWGFVLNADVLHFRDNLVCHYFESRVPDCDSKQLCVLLIDTTVPVEDMKEGLGAFSAFINTVPWRDHLEIATVLFDDVVHTVNQFQSGKGITLKIQPTKNKSRRAVEEAIVTGLYLIRNRQGELKYFHNKGRREMSWLFIFTDDESAYRYDRSFAHECIEVGWHNNQIGCCSIYMGNNVIAQKDEGHFVFRAKDNNLANELRSRIVRGNFMIDDPDYPIMYPCSFAGITPTHPLYMDGERYQGIEFPKLKILISLLVNVSGFMKQYEKELNDQIQTFINVLRNQFLIHGQLGEGYIADVDLAIICFDKSATVVRHMSEIHGGSIPNIEITNTNEALLSSAIRVGAREIQKECKIDSGKTIKMMYLFSNGELLYDDAYSLTNKLFEARIQFVPMRIGDAPVDKTMRYFAERGVLRAEEESFLHSIPWEQLIGYKTVVIDPFSNPSIDPPL